ncbi:MAG TPA: HAD family hydrolase [Gammaproteobacteria bacterium]|nr:HAD family hydrolase [Gammaproteobacteria bacterium]
MRIAMWSGPRNISTAMMRAWENRPDTAVIDEPFYACYLAATGLDHPARDEVIASQPTDWHAVAEGLTGPVPGGRAIYYQKHMTHHMLPDFGRDWLDAVTNCFLVRAPAEVVASYAETRRAPTLEDLGFMQQAEIFARVADRLGHAPPVLDAGDVLRDPAGMLAALCAAVGVAFDARMLSWPPGPRPTDGVWARHWYASVERSTGFNPLRAHTKPVPPARAPLAEAALPVYERLAAHRLRAVPDAGVIA